MALIDCPECGRKISDKSEICIGCGFPILDYLKKELENKKIEELENEKFFCKSCYRQNKIGSDYCEECGFRLTPYYKKEEMVLNSPKEKKLDFEKDKVFNGIYKYTLLGKKQEVYCPRCGSENCSHYKEQKIIPGKIKTRYTLNINPLKPFTILNKKEKLVRNDYEYTQNKILCNSCGYIFL